MKAFILAGGFATRLWPLTDARPKPLLPIAGKPLLSYIVEQIPREIPVTISTNAVFHPTFEEWQNSSIIRPVTIVVESARNDDEKLGALGALAKWIRTTDSIDDILLVTGDNYFGFSLTEFINAFVPGTPLIAAFDVGDVNKASGFGTIVTEESAERTKRVRSFEEKPVHPKTSLVSTGCTIIPREHIHVLLEFAAKHPDNVGLLFEEFLQRNIPVLCMPFNGHWFDIGSFHSYMEATKALVEKGIFHGEGTSMDLETVCEGSVVVGPGSSVRRCRLKNVVVLEGCILEDCVIDHHCVLRGVDLHGKMLMAETRMEQSAKKASKRAKTEF